MTIEEAFNIIYAATGALALKREDHIALQEALDVIKKKIVDKKK